LEFLPQAISQRRIEKTFFASIPWYGRSRQQCAHIFPVPRNRSRTFGSAIQERAVRWARGRCFSSLDLDPRSEDTAVRTPTPPKRHRCGRPATLPSDELRNLASLVRAVIA
jgi:hypothetical protein